MTGDLRPEVRLLLAAAAPRWDAAAARAVRAALSSPVPLDWAYFFGQALDQQVVSIMGRNFGRHLPRDRVYVPHLWVYTAAYEANARRNRGLFAEFGRILYALSQRGIRHAVRKGPSLCTLVYDDPGIRRMSDLDVLIERDSLDAATTVLTDLGYAQGVLSASGDRVIAHERKTQLFWAVHLNNSLPFLKPTSEPDVRWFEIDLCLDLFQKRSAGRIDIAAVLDRVRPAVVCGEPSFVLSPLDQLLDIGLHLYKEAVSYLSISRGRDLNLLRFIDVIQTLRATPPDALDRLPEFAADIGAERELYFAFYHADLLYPGSVPAAILSALRPADLSYLDEYGELEGRTRPWREGFPDRLFNPDRWAELPGPSDIPTA